MLNKYVAGFFSGVLGDKDKKKSDLLESPSKEAEAEYVSQICRDKAPLTFVVKSKRIKFNLTTKASNNGFKQSSLNQSSDQL